MENNTQTLDNIGQQNNNTEQSIESIYNNESIGPVVVEKPKRKKRETNIAAQLETLKRGRERLAEKRKQECEMKTKKTKNQAAFDIEAKHGDYFPKLNETNKKFNDDLYSIVSRINVPTETKAPLDHSTIAPKHSEGVAAPRAVPLTRTILFV